MRFGTVEFPRFQPNSGGYQLANPDEAGGVQILLNYRSGPKPFRVFSLRDIESKKVNPKWLFHNIVILGITDPRYKKTLQTGAIAGLNPEPGLIYGPEFQAHAVSQLISAVLDHRVLIQTLPDGIEYLAIACSGCFGIMLGQQQIRAVKSMLLNLAKVLLFNTVIGVISYFALIFGGWWFPIGPILFVFNLNSLGLSLFSFYQYNQDLKSRINEREHMIEKTFDVIHNGPLQRLALILRGVRDQTLAQDQLLHELESLNREIRKLSQDLEQDLLNEEESLRLGNGQIINLNRPVHDLFYEVYSSTLERNFPGFENLKVSIRSFAPIDDCFLSAQHKRGLCQFLEEALCNIGKHAIGATRLEAIGELNIPLQSWYTLRISDNGPGLHNPVAGQGTKQGLKLQTRLHGKFKRESRHPRGTCCELSWPLDKKKF
jgi:hypothetical protein